MTSFKKGTISVEDYTVQYIITGTGEHPVLFLPGVLGTSPVDFGPQFEAFNGSQFTLVGWDPPGFGGSKPHHDKEYFPTDFYFRDAGLAVKTMRSLGFENFSMAGWSNGGTTAMIAAAIYPQLVRKLVVWGTRSYIAQEDMQKIEKVENISEWSDRMKSTMAKVHGKEYPVLWASFYEAYSSIYKSGGEICSSRLKNIVAPTLVMFGEKDALVAVEHIHHLHNNIKGSQKIIFTEGKHNFHLKYQKEFNDAVQDFLNK